MHCMQNNIALDQQLIQDLLSKENEVGRQQAFDVYKKGYASKPIATLTLSGTTQIPAGTLVTGPGVSVTTVSGTVMEDSNDGTVVVQYDITNNLDSGCYVGGSPNPITAGCFKEGGELKLIGSSDTVAYTTVVNTNARTIQGFSLDADTRFRPVSADGEARKPYFPDFLKFVNYYGTFDYADEWITAAFTGGQTNFDNGDGDFTSLDEQGLLQVAQKGTAYLSVAMYVLRELEDAVDDCERGCETDDCNDDAVHALDEAVAFYTGVLEGTDGSGVGNLMYDLADKRCANFKTCGKKGNEVSGTAKVNIDIFAQFNDMKKVLRSSDANKCDVARTHKERIAQLIFVPFIQGTLRYSYRTATVDDPSDKEIAERAVFAAAVLPMVHSCNNDHAQTIYQNSKAENIQVDFGAVKNAFESVYSCLQISCDDIGGLVDENGDYFPGAESCGSGSSSSSDARTIGLAIGLPLLFLALFSAVCCIRGRRTKSEVEFKTDSEHV